MHSEHLFPEDNSKLEHMAFSAQASREQHPLMTFSRQAPIGLLLMAALLAFEVFNFDTTRFALMDLMGDVSFAGLRWASILALAFCAIDFAGLAHLFAPARDGEYGGETWYLMGAWLLGATMNALMTWWAVNLTLLNHELGNEVLNREQLLEIVPPFVAVLVWLTRILFIGAFSVAGNQFFEAADGDEAAEDSHAPFADDERELEHRSIAAMRPVREAAQTAPTFVGGAFRPVSRAPRPATQGLSARSRRRDEPAGRWQPL